MNARRAPVSRRLVLKTLCLGATALGLPGVAGVPEGAGPLVLPRLRYPYDALVPHIDARTMEIHHARHHQAYVAAANQALKSRPDLRDLAPGDLAVRLGALDEPLRTTLRDQLGGHWNHGFFWTLLAPPAAYRPGPLRAALARKFGSLENFENEFTRAALGRFGSGWAWLVWQEGELRVISTPDQDSPLMNGARPIIGLDVWEHAYYLAYQDKRADYVKAFWRVLDWDTAESTYAGLVF